MDRFHYLAPANVCVLVLPVGQIERSRFLDFVGRLQTDGCNIALEDVTQYAGDNDFLLSPKRFPRGSVFYNYTTSAPSEQQLQLSPYELFREPLLVLGVVERLNAQDDAKEKELVAAAEYLRERHPRVVHRQLLALEDLEGPENGPALKSAVREITARFLLELTTYTQALQASPSIQTPGQTARSLQITSSLRENENLSGSGRTTPRQSVESLSSTESSPERLPTVRHVSSPPTSFDQIASANTAPSRSNSRARKRNKQGGRASSQDRVSVQGFGSNTSSARLALGGKLRVGIVIGSIYMMAGHWTEALRVLGEHTNQARLLGDHLWHAKGLENIVVCVFLHGLVGLDFHVPPVVYAIAERTYGHVHRFTVNLPSDFRTADAAQHASARRFEGVFPELVKHILSLYRSREGSLELPFVAVSEATIRFCKMLASVHCSDEESNKSPLSPKAGSSTTSEPASQIGPSLKAATSLSKDIIADLVSHARPTSEGNVPVADQIVILAGIASVYALIRMHRKRAFIVKELIAKLTSALTQARKRGAAEMGIHPAASLSAEKSADTLLSFAESGEGLSQIISEMAITHGLQLFDPPATSHSTMGPSFFGSDALKREILQGLIAFCEALPDLDGVLRLNALMLRAFGPHSAVDTEPRMVPAPLPKDEQVTASTTISRTVGMTKHLGLPVAEIVYWDQFLVRGVEFKPPSPSRAVIDRSKAQSATALHTQVTNGHVYVNRPGTAASTAEVSQAPVLVQGELADCIVTLQNPYEVSVDVESLQLVAEGVKLMTSHRPIILEPMRLQQVLLSISPCSVGDFKVTGCRIKIFGCAKQTFPVVSKPWAPAAPTLIKRLGQETRVLLGRTEHIPVEIGPHHTTLSGTAIEPLPTLIRDRIPLSEAMLMLLDGEKQDFSISLHNTSDVEASVFDVVPSSDVVQLQTSPEVAASALRRSGRVSTLTDPVQIEPGSTATLRFQIVGRPGVSRIQTAFYYNCQSEGPNSGVYARVLSVPIDVTVNAALQVQHLDAVPLDKTSFDDDADTFVLRFDLGNAWPRSLSYHCGLADAVATPEEHSNLPRQKGVLAPGEVQRICLPMARSIVWIGFDEDVEAARKSLLRRLFVKWSGDGRVGQVAVSGLSISPEALDLVRGAPVDITLGLVEFNGAARASNPVPRVGSFVTLRARLVNPATPSTPLVVELHSRTLNSADSAHDERRLAIAGAQHKVLSPIPVGGEAVVDFALCPLLSGMTKLEVMARPTLFKKDVKGLEWRVRRSLVLRVV